jgi:alpha-N-acetylglucosaminidase
MIPMKGHDETMIRLALLATCIWAALDTRSAQGGKLTQEVAMSRVEGETRIVINGTPTAAIVLGRHATPIERHAADELVKYVKAMSGATLPIREGERPKAQSGEKTALLIGRAETNPLIADLVRQGQVRLSADYPGLDGFIIKTIGSAGASPSHSVVIGGSADRATLYAVYHLLERFCGVGFFWDGDYVPKKKTISLPLCDIAERPLFRIRQYLQGCAFGYTTAYWEWEDWKRELDWMAKRYQNTMMVDWGHPEGKHIAEYARKLGIHTILPGAGLGEVSEEFVKQHPNVRYVKMQWGESAPCFVVHPSDPMFVQRGVETIQRNVETYGTDHIYNVDPYPEQTVFLEPDEIEKMRVEFARATAAYIRKADPQGIWYASGWALLAPPWPEKTAQAFLEAIPADMFYICDIWADENPIYQKFNYFHGRDWGFGVLHSFGGDDILRGDVAGLISRVQEVANDTKANRCVAFYINPEIIHYNLLYFELAAKLSWQPGKVNLEDFLRDYAVRRYGEKSAPTMRECLERLARSVYSSSSRATEPYYQHRLHTITSDASKYAHLDDLREALRIALWEAKDQKDNPLYANDLVDIMRQYIAELSNLHLQQLYSGFTKGDKETFEREAKTVNRLMDGLEKVLSSRDDYRVDWILAKAQRMGRTERDLKDGFLTLASTPWLLDYQSKDLFELVRFYYRRRVEAFIGALRDALKPVRGLPTTPNLLLNSGFEEGEGSQPAHWGTGFVYKGGTAVRTKEAGCSGEFCGRLDSPEQGAYSNLFQDVRVNAGEAYYLNGRVKVKGECRVSFAADFRTGEWPQSNYHVEYDIGGGFQGEHDWTPVSGYFVVPTPRGGKEGDAVILRLYCRQEGSVGTAWFDDVRLQRVAVEEAPVLRTETLDAAYEQIEKEWLEKPLKGVPKRRRQPVPAVREAFRDLEEE